MKWLKHWRATLALVLVSSIIPFVFHTNVAAMSWKRWALLTAILCVYDWAIRLDELITSEHIG